MSNFFIFSEVVLLVFLSSFFSFFFLLLGLLSSLLSSLLSGLLSLACSKFIFSTLLIIFLFLSNKTMLYSGIINSGFAINLISILNFSLKYLISFFKILSI